MKRTPGKPHPLYNFGFGFLLWLWYGTIPSTNYSVIVFRANKEAKKETLTFILSCCNSSIESEALLKSLLIVNDKNESNCPERASSSLIAITRDLGRDVQHEEPTSILSSSGGFCKDDPVMHSSLFRFNRPPTTPTTPQLPRQMEEHGTPYPCRDLRVHQEPRLVEYQTDYHNEFDKMNIKNQSLWNSKQSHILTAKMHSLLMDSF